MLPRPRTVAITCHWMDGALLTSWAMRERDTNIVRPVHKDMKVHVGSGMYVACEYLQVTMHRR